MTDLLRWTLLALQIMFLIMTIGGIQEHGLNYLFSMGFVFAFAWIVGFITGKIVDKLFEES